MQYLQLYYIYQLGCFSSKLHKPTTDSKNNRLSSQITRGLMMAVFCTYWCSRSITTSSLWSYKHSPDGTRAAIAPSITRIQKIMSKEKEDRRHFLLFIPNLLKGKPFWGLLRRPELGPMPLLLSKAVFDCDAQIRISESYPRAVIQEKGGYAPRGH